MNQTIWMSALKRLFLMLLLFAWRAIKNIEDIVQAICEKWISLCIILFCIPSISGILCITF